MKLSIIGHLSMDVFHTPDGAEREEAGGILRALGALSALAGRGDGFTPVAGVTRKELPAMRERLEAMQGVQTDGLYVHDTPVHRIHYYYQNERDFVACTHDLAPPIPFAKIKPNLDVHGILINMVSGADITLDTLDEIRMAVRHESIPVHLDLHSLTLGVNDRHERFRRPLPDWRRWAFMIDTIQMNEEEVAGLTVEGMEEERAVGHILMLGVKGVLITRGVGGVSVYMSEQKKVLRTDLAVPAVDPTGTSIGRGDMFGAAFLYHYVKNHNVLAAAESAQASAAGGQTA
jgi:sugar/nucleoside kinase (ribokinase family)